MSRLAGLAICEDFAKKMGDFEAALQGRLKGGKRLEASRAKLIYLAAWLLGESSLSCLATRQSLKVLHGRRDLQPIP